MHRLVANASLGRVFAHRKASQFMVAIPSSIQRMQFSTNHNTEEKRKLSLKERVQNLWKKYGYTCIGTYFGLYGLTLGCMYFALDNDVLNAASFGLNAATATTNVCDFVSNNLGITTFPEYVKSNPEIGTLVIAWVMTEFTEPIRLAATVAIVPPLAKALGTTTQNDASSSKDSPQKSI